MNHRVPTRSQSRGYSLLEILMALALLGILIAMTTVGLRSRTEQEGPRGLAFALASELRAARAEAQKTGQTVAVCFPSDEKKNSLSRSAVVRRGAQKGAVWRSLSFESEFAATIFLGTWPGAVLQPSDVPPSWTTSIRNEIAIFFRPDGTAFSNDLPSVDGAIPVLVGSALMGNFSGPTGILTGAVNPQTIWVSSSGSIQVEPNKVPVGTLPSAGESHLTVASLVLKDLPSSSPEIIDPPVLYPEPVDPDQGTGIGQSFVQLHPFQKSGEQLEYGLATIEVNAKDADGGPLSYVLSAEAIDSTGEPGDFTVPELKGQMKFVLDPKTNTYMWKAVVSWRPPPGAPTDSTYFLTLTVRDPEGNEAVASSRAGLLPKITALPPARIAMVTNNHRLFITNLDGGGEVRINPDETDMMPFFSRDGSQLFTFHPGATGHTLRSRLSDGTPAFETLASISGDPRDVWIDPTGCFAMITDNVRENVQFPWGRVNPGSSGGSDGESTPPSLVSEPKSTQSLQSLNIINLMTGDRLHITEDAKADSFEWASNYSHLFSYVDVTETALKELKGKFPIPYDFGWHHEHPGYKDPTLTKYLVGNPFTAVDSSLPVVSSRHRRYNPANPDWYAHVAGNVLRVVKGDGTEEKNISTGAFDNNPWGPNNPTWSANGQYLITIQSPGAGAVIKSFRIFDSAGKLLASPEEIYSKALPNARLAQLDPEGKWIYYLQDGHIFRTANDSKKATKAISISEHINANMESYVISP